MIKGNQIRAGRALIRWSAEDLARASKLGIATIRRAEAAEDSLPITSANADAIHRALEAAGVQFLGPHDAATGPGVALKAAETAADLTHKIDTIEADIQKTKGPSAQTPKGGMRTLERAHKRNAVAKLKNQRTGLGKTKK